MPIQQRSKAWLSFLVFILAASSTVIANHESQSRATLLDLRTETMIEIPVRKEVTVIKSIKKYGLDLHVYEVKYIAEIPASLFYEESSRVDSSVSYRLTLTQMYYEIWENNLRYVAVEEYVGEWESLDPQVTGTKGGLIAGVNGPELGGGWLYDTDEIPEFSPEDWALETLIPYWAGEYVCVSDDEGPFYQCGRIYVTLLREPTGHTWEFDLMICQGCFFCVPWP